jgi:hypothetical protein
MKTFLFIFALSLSQALAQFGWDEEPVADPVQAAVDRIDDAVRTPVIESPTSACLSTFNQRPVTPPPAVPVVPWSGSPVVRAEEALIEQCDLKPEIAQAYRASVLSDSTRHPSPATSDIGQADCPQFLGRLSANPYAADSTANPYDPDSVSNPYGRYGSPYSSASINNPYSTYGSPYSSQSPNNPYATQAPLLFGD